MKYFYKFQQEHLYKEQGMFYKVQQIFGLEEDYKFDQKQMVVRHKFTNDNHMGWISYDFNYHA